MQHFTALKFENLKLLNTNLILRGALSDTNLLWAIFLAMESLESVGSVNFMEEIL